MIWLLDINVFEIIHRSDTANNYAQKSRNMVVARHDISRCGYRVRFPYGVGVIFNISRTRRWPGFDSQLFLIRSHFNQKTQI